MDSSSSQRRSDSPWNVFISFIRKDTLETFVSDLIVALSNAGIKTFLNPRADVLGPELRIAIERSSISIVVFSKNYADSKCCLDELVEIMKCRRTHGKVVIPVFYDVQPSEVKVRLQKCDLENLFRGVQSGKDELIIWRNALTDAANLVGWVSNNFRDQGILVQKIVEDVLRQLNRELLSITKFPVGLETRVQKLIEFIKTQSNKVCLIGIWGMGGSGKTTTAKAIYNQIHHQFVNTSFIENVREFCENGGVIRLQEQLLSDVIKTNKKIHDIASRITTIKRILMHEKTLIVLDDVTTFEQVEAIGANPECFGSGSVLIVTTRDARILRRLKVDYVCTMKEMDEKESLALFSLHAFRDLIPRADFSELSKNVVAYCGGLPFALEVLGSYLYEKTKEEWVSVLSKLERKPNVQVLEKLRISYDGLEDDMEKNVFLDICCFFIGKDITDVTAILNSCGFHAETGINILVEKSLVKIENNNKLGMHDLIRDMGREIVCESSAKEPGRRSRLWFHDDVRDVLTKNSGTETVEGLVLKSQRTDKVCFSTDSFEEMKKLRLLQLDHVDLTGDYGKLSKELRWVHWQGSTFNYIPDDFHQENLVVIELKHSNIKQVWNETKVLVNLKILNLSHSRYLQNSPDFSKLPNLVKLIMKDCPCLSEIHPSIGDLNNLLLLNLKDCTGLSNLPKKIYQLKSLKTLILSGCFKIDKLEEDIEQMESLTTLITENTSVNIIPFSIVRSKSIGYISHSGYERLSRDVFTSLIWSGISPTMNSLSHISPFENMSLSLASINVLDNYLGFLSPMVSSLLQLRTVVVRFRSEIQLTQELPRILYDQYDVSVAKLETSRASQISNLSMRSLLIGMSSFHTVTVTLTKSIPQVLTTNDSSEYFLPGDNYPSWLAYRGEGPSVHFQVPEDHHCCLKGITLCVVYSSASENNATECLASVLLINYTRFTVHIYKRDTIMSFNDEDWKNVTSNLGLGDNVEIFVAFGHGLIVKETVAYLIYDQSTAMEIEPSLDIIMQSEDANQRDMNEASKRHDKILNQSEDADEKGTSVNDVDPNRRISEQIPYAVAESLFNRLTSVVFREHVRSYGVMDELERLKNSVESVRVVLSDAQEKQEQDCVVQNWIRRLNDVLHFADDLLDEFIIKGMRFKMDEAHKNKATQVFSSLSPKKIVFRFKVAKKIEEIQKEFNDVVKDMSRLNLNPNVVMVEQTNSVNTRTSSYVLESDIIGREDDKKEIINLLRQLHGNISSIAIVGIGGIGKTTLAQFVYNDVEVQNHFEKRMWVCVSNNFDVKTIVKKMLESLLDSKIDEKSSFENIQHNLHEILTGERYLLVLDDMCNASHTKWTQLRTYLMCGAEDSKVLMTTRSKIVLERLEVCNLYALNGLSQDVSWRLLKTITFGIETRGVNQKLESIGQKIAKNCMGVPLAIRTLGGLLQSKREEREWINVLQGDFWELCEDTESIMPILKLSYQSLSLRLRQCFAYCSLYPKDWDFEKDLLIQLWMAQGYLECSNEKQLMEDVGNEFVKIFLMKSFFQDAKVGDDGDIVSFKIHDLMHDLATQVSGNDCCYIDNKAKICVQRPMHVSLEPNAIHLLDSLDARRLRTLILLSSNGEEELNGDEWLVISKFKYLRVLKLSYCSLSNLSGSIGKLKHLRYLNLSHCRGLGSLYKSIGNLVFLQTLILTPDEKVEFSTEVVSKLINLRHLHISDWEASRDKTPSGLVKLSIWQHEGMVFSNWLSSLTNIVEISFFLCGSLRYLPPLERLPFLKSLHISFLEELEYIYYEKKFPSSFFPSLESLSLQFCYKLKGWWRMGDNTSCSQDLSLPPFPRLSQLSIIGCPMLTCMPTFPNLENGLELYDSSVETLVATLNISPLECLNEFPPLSLLKSLHIDRVSLDVESIPKVWMQNLTSLKRLQINWFSRQTFQEIEIWFKDDLKCFPSLQIISFHNCEELEALPDWICSLSSLQHLRVYDCINLASLPEGMPCLTNLQTLEIIGCPLLVEECQTQTGETWPNIVHVPNIILSSLH